jgi:hypothetical protein
MRQFRIVSDIVSGVGSPGPHQPFEIAYTVKNEGDEAVDHRHYVQVWGDGQEAIAARYVHVPVLHPEESHFTSVTFPEGFDAGQYSVFLSVDCDIDGGSYQYQSAFDVYGSY